MSDTQIPEERVSSGQIATTAVMLAIFSGMSALALTFPAKAAFAPLLIGVPGALLCLAQLLLDLRARSRAHGSADRGPAGGSGNTERRELLMFAWLAIFTASIVGFGFYVGGTAAVFLYIRFASHEPWRNAILGALGTFVVFWVVFNKLLELSLFEGLILARLW